MALIHGTPSIVLNGLVLALDAANSKSYPGTGTTWTDLSGLGNNGTLTNGPTYSSANGGSIVFDGVNDKIVVPYNIALNPQTVTLSLWFKRNAVVNFSQFATLPYFNNNWNAPFVSYGFQFQGLSNDLGFILGFTNGQWAYATATGLSALAVGSWVNAVGTYDGSFSRIYINGSLITSVAETRTLSSGGADFILGTETRDTNSYPINGQIGVTQIYNRALTAAEVSQNFNAIRGRYGI